MNRRSILKLGLGALLLPIISGSLFAQSSSGIKPVGIMGANPDALPRIDGIDTYNAGWITMLEDKPGLLELEAKKTKALQEKTAKPAADAAAPAPAPKEKGVMGKVQDFFGKVKGWF
ncbi:hypothetical protein [Polynucleobacter sp. AP-Melu-500A-A1]|uniref:hypothetical protein n=1 Tax=Polynucleobacter sp. AP-Melu-500A-A1 TaxID=2576929 RepID=UPI001C0E77CC|nr:hypothetical protein [Polynucleobacter sp. AP-Melu-500A-A1]MBU3630102.1 hypothetical protein [Polynucleobacter sp. AP-Melu-500A-A1]